MAVTHLIHRQLYRLWSRNLKTGVWNDATQCFIGIRSKFGVTFLDAEYHRDNGGTAVETEDTGKSVPDTIELVTSHGPICSACELPVKWDGPPAPANWSHMEPNDCVADVCPMMTANVPLYQWIEEGI